MWRSDGAYLVKRTKARYYTGRSKYVYLTELREVIANNRDDLARTKKALPIWANRACAAGWARIEENVLKDLEYVERKMKELHEFVLEISDEVSTPKHKATKFQCSNFCKGQITS
jgi:hypothetical protein